MKNPLIPFAVIVIYTGCVAAEIKPGATVPVIPTNVPPVVNSTATNQSTTPVIFTIRLDAETQSNLVQAIVNGGKKASGPIQDVLTNTNPVSFPNSMAVTLGETTLASLSPKPESWWKNLLPLFSTLLGACIAYWASQKVTTRSHELQVKRKIQEDAEFVRRLEACIATELDMLGKFYNNGIGRGLSSPQTDGPLRIHFALTEKWFTVFEANANHLGKFEDHKSASIIKIYGLMKSMVEYFRINNLLLDQLEVVEEYLTRVLKDADACKRRQTLIHQMTGLSAMLKDLETNLKQEVERFHNFRKKIS